MTEGLTEVNGAPASYMAGSVGGGGTVAIVTAGLGLSSRFYEGSYDAFARAGIRLVTPDLPGWGATPGPRLGLAVEDSAGFLLAFVKAMGIRHAYWIGHSLGAQVVAEVAVRRPDLARGIVLVGPTGAPGRLKLARQAAALTVEAGRTTLPVIGAVAREYIRTPPWRYLGTWVKHGRDELVPRLLKVRCPALILAGDRDPICPPSFIELLRHRLPDAQVEWVRGGTHALPRGHAAEFNRLITGWIRELGRPAAP